MHERTLRRGFLACTLAALLSVLMPGLGHLAVRARFRRGVAAAIVGNLAATIVTVAIALPIRNKADLADVVADRPTFVGLGLALAVMAITRLWAALDAGWQARPATGTALRIVTGLATSTVVIACVAPLAVAADYVLKTDRAVSHVFSSRQAVTAYPGPVSDTDTATRRTTPSTGTTPTITTVTINTTTTVATAAATFGETTVAATTPTNPPVTAPRTTTTLPPIVAENRVNVLLLGGDAGPGRWSLRTDSMIVISLDPVTGDTVMISVPRNLQRMPFPPGTAMADRFPNGFTDIANAVYTYADQHRELAGGGDDAGAQAIKLGIAQLLGMPIHHYVLVDMAGFVDVVDALGGVDIDVAARVPSPGNPPGSKHPVPKYIEAGLQHMDGTIALAYSRSRYADSDYQRMSRQRCVLGAIATAATPMAVATGLTELVAAFGDAVRTDIPRERLGELAQLVDHVAQAGGLGQVRTLHLAPPLISSTRWDAVEVRLLVTELIAAGDQAGELVVDDTTPTTETGPVLVNGC